jgi:hypothetical protein
VVLNPVRARLCDDPADWPWSSYCAMIGRAPRPDFLVVESLLSQFGSELEPARSAYRDFVNDALPRALR